MIGLDLPFVADAAAAIDQMHGLLAGRGITEAILLGASFSGFFVQAYARTAVREFVTRLRSHDVADR